MSINKKSQRQKNASVGLVADPNGNESLPHTSRNNEGVIKDFFAYIKTPHWWAVALVAFLSLGVLGAGLKYLEDTAREQRANQRQNPLAEKNESLLSRLNPFMPAPTPAPTPQLSKEYIYAGSRLLAVEDVAASAIPPGDLAVWRPSSGVWYCLGGVGSQQFAAAWGANGDDPRPGDYDGDGKTDLAIYRPPTGGATALWWILRSSDGSYYTVSLGLGDDKLAPADYDGDGKTDPAVLHSGSNWSVWQSSTQSVATTSFGMADDLPVPADYDGDGKADVAVWRGSAATFYVLRSTNNQWQSQTLGATGDVPVPADYDGDGKADYALKRGSNWIIKQSTDGQTSTISWGQSWDLPVQNDYDSDGKVDIAVWRPYGKGEGNWYIRNSHDTSTRVESWGMNGDIPVPAYFRR